MASTFDIQIDKDWTLFLDRDGVINRRIKGDYIKTVEEFEFLSGVLDAMPIFQSIFKYIVIVTNQQGIGKEVMTHQDLATVHKHMTDIFLENGVSVDQVYYCPFLAHTDPPCRKPNPGMAIQAQQDFPSINFRKSIMVGDSDSDILFGKNLKMKTVKISTSYDREADFTHPSLYDLSLYMKNYL